MSYKVSKDYPRMKRLLDDGYKIACWMTCDWGRFAPDIRTDIAEISQAGNGEYTAYAMLLRGNCIFDFHPDRPIENSISDGVYEEWESHNLQFIDPDPSRNTLDLERVN